MAGESTEERTVSVALPAALAEWLEDRAGALGVEREELLVQLVGSYRIAAGIEDDAIGDLDRTLSEFDVGTAVEEALSDQRVDISASVAERVDDRLDDHEARLEEELDEIRRRVVQLKREIDGKAPADHAHEELDRLDDLVRRLDTLESAVADLEADTDARPDPAERDARLDDIESKLARVARVVVDLHRTIEAESRAGPATGDGDADVDPGVDGTADTETGATDGGNEDG